jgi:hypothetical protein
VWHTDSSLSILKQKNKLFWDPVPRWIQTLSSATVFGKIGWLTFKREAYFLNYFSFTKAPVSQTFSLEIEQRFFAKKLAHILNV